MKGKKRSAILFIILIFSAHVHAIFDQLIRFGMNPLLSRFSGLNYGFTGQPGGGQIGQINRTNIDFDTPNETKPCNIAGLWSRTTWLCCSCALPAFGTKKDCHCKNEEGTWVYYDDYITKESKLFKDDQEVFDSTTVCGLFYKRIYNV